MKTALQILDEMIEFIESWHSEYTPREDLIIKYSLEEAKIRIQKEIFLYGNWNSNYIFPERRMPDIPWNITTFILPNNE